jgi:hypothetical protein
MGFGGGKSGGGKGAGTGGPVNSAFDLNAIFEGLGMGSQAISNRYKQLGLGNPDPNTFGGDPATAAKAGGSLAFGSPGTAQQTDIGGLFDLAQGALGQLQTQNLSNPAIPGTPANQIQSNNQLTQLAGQANQAAGQADQAAGAAAAGTGTSAAPQGT